MNRMAVVSMLVALLAAPHSQAAEPGVSRVMDVIEAAAAAEGEPIEATIEIVVQATGMEPGARFLNSEKDYRDQRNVTVVVRPSMVADLARRFGAPFPGSLVGQRIRVSGQARRVQIWFFSQGMRTDKYYYQTHLVLSDGSNLQRVLE